MNSAILSDEEVTNQDQPTGGGEEKKGIKWLSGLFRLVSVG
jgi:hypothetical protein